MKRQIFMIKLTIVLLFTCKVYAFKNYQSFSFFYGYYININQKIKMKKIFEGMRAVLSKKPKKTNPNLQKCNIRKQNHNQSVESSQVQALSQDYCKSCQINMCAACADDHIVSHCEMKLATNINMGVGILRHFNFGVLIKADLRDLRCICGKKLGNDAAICAACGLASCSLECHKCWQKQGNCTYNQNFLFKNASDFSIRSILFQNIQNIRKANIKRWNPAQRTNLNLISCYASKEKNFVYFQRGYRNYGNPNPELIERFEYAKIQSMAKQQQNNQAEIIKKYQEQYGVPQNLRGIDFQTHIERICTCTCLNCTNRGINQHSIGNCEYGCLDSISRVRQSKDIDPKNQMQCKCECSFCRSGIIMDTHRIIDCYFHCQVKKNNKYFIWQ